jgi:glycosyltransferase involved in cell wall biosynthesis
MRVGQNPAKVIESVPMPQTVTVAVIVYIPFLSGFYNQSLDVLKACLGSLWENTSNTYDLLVFDNASCTEVREYLSAAHNQGKIQYLVLSDKNVGKGGAWNFIFQAAPGEYIVYADSDIAFYPGWLNESLAILEAFPKVGMVTARPMRTPETFYSNTLEWARSAQDVSVENGRYIPWEVYLQHVLSLGTSQDQAHEWYESRSDWRVTRQGVSALIGAAHFQFTARKDVLQQFLPFSMDRPMGQVRSLDERLNDAGYLRLTSIDPLVKHLGNRLDAAAADQKDQPTIESRKRIVDISIIRKSLLWLYDGIFKLYHQ